MRKSIAILLTLNALLLADFVWLGSSSHGEVAPANGDVNGDGEIDIADPISLLAWLFSGGPAPVPCRSDDGPVGLPDTGQTTCYDAEGHVIDCHGATDPGQDGSHATGCPSEGRFVDNGDGTVTDNCTGLMWQKDTGSDGNPLVWRDALAYCDNLDLGGHDDWRLPNVRELLSIVDYGRLPPAIAPVFGVSVAIDPVFGEASVYWSSTSIEVNPVGAYIVSFAAGVVIGGAKDSDRLVRAVRSALVP
jgi:Protein of unknown function (DUF1566)